MVPRSIWFRIHFEAILSEKQLMDTEFVKLFRQLVFRLFNFGFLVIILRSLVFVFFHLRISIFSNLYFRLIFGSFSVHFFFEFNQNLFTIIPKRGKIRAGCKDITNFSQDTSIFTAILFLSKNELKINYSKIAKLNKTQNITDHFKTFQRGGMKLSRLFQFELLFRFIFRLLFSCMLVKKEQR